MSQARTVAERVVNRDKLLTLPLDETERARARAHALTRSEPYALDRSVFQHIEAVAARAPERVALCDDSARFSYAELVVEVRRLASLILTHRPVRGEVVAVGGPRNANFVISFLAVELLGGVYLPVDHCWPALRICEVLETSQAIATLSTSESPGSSLFEAAAAGCISSSVWVRDRAKCRPWEQDARAPAPDEPRYVLYTSGSTGAPKGAVIEHQGMLNHLHCKVQDLRVSSDDRIAQTAPVVFDISLWQMLTPLLVGGSTHILGDEDAQDAERLLDAVGRQGITILEVVPTLMRMLLSEHERRRHDTPLCALRWLLATGEALPPDTARRWIAALPEVPIVNAYGPTECSDDVTHYTVEPPPQDLLHLPIGTPVANTALYVLEETAEGWRACEDNQPGELFVGGVGVGRGYLGDLERTRAVFFQDPFEDTRTGRLYRTGDAVRRLPGGPLEYLGRLDRQVKVSGVRMELGEIEAVLREHPAVDDCAVAVARASGGSLIARETMMAAPAVTRDRLVAYVCPNSFEEQALREFLGTRLPMPMVPEVFVPLTALPLTRNGKIDYANLPEPQAVTLVSSRSYEPPRHLNEKLLAEVMELVLGVGRVGRRDSFFELGGDSIAAMRVVAAVRSRGHVLAVRDLLFGQDVAAIAARIAPVRIDSEPTQPVDDRAVSGAPRRCSMTPQQEGIYFHWRLAPENPYYSYQGSLRLDGVLEIDRLRAAWDTLLLENPALLARFEEDDGAFIQEYPSFSVEFPEVEDLSHLEPARRSEVYRAAARDEAVRAFDLSNQPVLRVAMYSFGPHEHRLLMTMHEILLDGWGANVLCERLAALYERGQSEPLHPDPALMRSYDEYLAWEQERLQGAPMRNKGAYWRDQLSGSLPVLELPVDHPRPFHRSHRGEIIEAIVDAETTAALRSLCAAAGYTPFMVFLAAYALSLSYYSNTDEVVVGAPTANRDTPEQSRVTAFLLNMLPLRVEIDPALSARDYLSEVRALVLAGFDAADHPFGWMLRSLDRVQRTSSATPVFQTMLNMLNYPTSAIERDGVRFEFTELHTGFTKYDCALYVQSHGPQQLLMQLAYQSDLFIEQTAQRILDTTQLALHALIYTPQATVRDIDLLSAADRARLADLE